MRERQKKPWKCWFGFHAYGEPHLVGILTMREQCSRCGMARYFSGVLGEHFYRREAINDEQ